MIRLFRSILIHIMRIETLMVIMSTTISKSSSSSCQSGLREDNSNYIYCARQSLEAVPNFFSSSSASSNAHEPAAAASASLRSVNVVYDELVLSDNLIGSIDETSFANNLKVYSHSLIL